MSPSSSPSSSVVESTFSMSESSLLSSAELSRSESESESLLIAVKTVTADLLLRLLLGLYMRELCDGAWRPTLVPRLALTLTLRMFCRLCILLIDEAVEVVVELIMLFVSRDAVDFGGRVFISVWSGPSDAVFSGVRVALSIPLIRAVAGPTRCAVGPKWKSRSCCF